MPYWCSDCRSYFSVRTGTALERSKVPLRKWAFAVYIVTTSLKSVSSMKLHRDLGVTQKTAWFMLHRLREALVADCPENKGGAGGSLPIAFRMRWRRLVLDPEGVLELVRAHALLVEAAAHPAPSPNRAAESLHRWLWYPLMPFGNAEPHLRQA